MAYEIPQNLKYEEKIIFGLTLGQMFWLGLFGGIGVIVFLKTNLDFTVRVLVAIVFLGVGVGFAFLNFFGHLKILKSFYFSPREMGFFDKKLDSFVQITEIRDDALFLLDGSAKAVIQVLPIHFSLLSIEEQRAIVAAYRDFLNSLDFPIQIVMRTVDLSLREYLAVLQQKVVLTKNSGLVRQFESFKSFIQTYIVKNKIKNRLFYVVIPSTASNAISFFFKKSQNDRSVLLSQLDIRCKICSEKLKRSNLLTNRLNSNELISLVSGFFEGFIEAQNECLSTLTILEKGVDLNETKKRSWFDAQGKRIEPNVNRNC